MGYTHYYDVSPEFNAEQFEKVATDFRKMTHPLKMLGVILADGRGENTPIISPTEIIFNGLEKCGHQERELGITWPSKNAKGVAKNSVGTILSDITQSQWFAGASLVQRACGGDCSHETFSLTQKSEGEGYNPERTEAKGLQFNFTKTAYKPYDLAVNVCLIIAKHHLKEAIQVRSDGEMINWEEGMQLCQHFLGYGKDFKLDDEE